MKTLIIHIGAPKCGSSSIQDFFRDNKNCCTQNIKFVKLTLEEVNELNKEGKVKSESFTEIFSNYLNSCDTLILSQESLFDQKNAIKNICSYLSSKVSEIIIIGYCRNQSNFLISLYNQIGFRWPTFASIGNEVILEEGITPIHFSGVEKFMITLIINDFNLVPIMNWNDSFKEIEQIVSAYKTKIKVGTLPKHNFSENLIEDFCNKAKLVIKDEFKELTKKRTNLTFNSNLTEAIFNGVEHKFNMPDPKSENDIIHNISKKIRSDKNFNDEFHLALMQYIDSYFMKNNKEFCARYSINQNYFEASNINSKEVILEIVRNEELTRKKNNTMLKRQKELTGILAEALYNSYKKQAQKREISINQKKVRGLKLLWHYTPESIRKIGRKIFGI